MLIPKVILEALLQSLQSVLPSGTTLLQAGDSHDSSLSPAWVECWVDRVASPVARRTASQCRIDLSFTVNCLGRPPATPSQVQTLAETIRRNLTCLSMPYQLPAGGSGLVTLLEAEMRDLSRPATQKSASLLQWTVTVRGTLYPCSPAQQ
jgi:hypothetical protein